MRFDIFTLSHYSHILVGFLSRLCCTSNEREEKRKRNQKCSFILQTEFSYSCTHHFNLSNLFHLIVLLTNVFMIKIHDRNISIIVFGV